MTHRLPSDYEDEGFKVPEPALIRGAVVAVTALIAGIFGRNIDISWLDWVLAIYTWVAPLIAGYLIRNKVTPTNLARYRERKALLMEPPAQAA